MKCPILSLAHPRKLPSGSETGTPAWGKGKWATPLDLLKTEDNTPKM